MTDKLKEYAWDTSDWVVIKDSDVTRDKETGLLKIKKPTPVFTQEDVEMAKEAIRQWIVGNLNIKGQPPVIFDKEYLSLTKAALEAVGVITKEEK